MLKCFKSDLRLICFPLHFKFEGEKNVDDLYRVALLVRKGLRDRSLIMGRGGYKM